MYYVPVVKYTHVVQMERFRMWIGYCGIGIVGTVCGWVVRHHRKYQFICYVNLFRILRYVISLTVVGFVYIFASGDLKVQMLWGE